jgi:PIN domain nuclease of toxin-antitoxin system
MTETRYLADTHILLWALGDDKRLTERHRAILLSTAEVFFSAASVWEIAIKKALGKLRAPDHLAALLPQAGFRVLDITPVHAEAIMRLPPRHADPFDRLLIAQAKVEKLTVLTVDSQFSFYDINLA